MEGQSGISPEVLPLPGGGGAVRGIGESFEPDLHTGTGNFPVPLWFPPGAGKIRPETSLSYSTGAGNGPFGMGWRLEPLRIVRSTDRGLPTYDDQSDVFLLDASELVPLQGGHYRSRSESSFIRLERAGDGWEARDRGGRRFIFGDTDGSRVFSTTGGATRIAAWYVSRVIDRLGNEIRYGYRRDRGRLYLESIRYAIYTVTFDYAPRPDVFTDRRFGFDVTTALRGTSVTIQADGDPDPFAGYDLTYDECPHSRLSLLASVTFRGDRDGVRASLPPLRFSYTEFQPSRRYTAFTSSVDSPPPRPLSDPDFDLVDLFAGGLPGVVELSENVKRYWPNKGGGRWGAPRRLDRLPGPVALSESAVAMADLDGNATADLLVLDEQPLGYYRNEPGVGWTHKARFSRAPEFDHQDGELRLLDLDGDGIVDAMRSTPGAFYLYYNRGSRGWERPVAVPRVRDLRVFPDVSLSDPRVKLADMTGDGLIDIAYVHDGRIDYWPHLGRGKFGPRVTLRRSVVDRRGFDPNRLFLSDVNGDGLADVIYVDRDRVYVWINRSGAELSPAQVIHHTPITDSDSVALADMEGSGTAGVLWSYPSRRRDPENYKFLDFTGGTRPYLLSKIDHGIGLETEIRYSPSTAHRLAAEAAGDPWSTALPFAVPTVTELLKRDRVTGVVSTQRIQYHDGWLDPEVRAFRGFARVESIDLGDAECPSTRTVSHFHQGRAATAPGVDPTLVSALAGRLYGLEVYDAADPEHPLRREENRFGVRKLATSADGVAVLFAHLTRSTVEVLEGSAQPQTSITELDYDDFGNVIAKRELWDGDGAQQNLNTEMSYTADVGRWVLNLPVERIERDAGGTVLSLERFYYDGNPFVGLPLGQVNEGRLRRLERMVIGEAALQQLFGANVPDLAALGFHPLQDPDGNAGWAVDSAAYDHDVDGNVSARRNEHGETTTLVRDADGLHLGEVRNPLQQVTKLTYDRHFGKLTRVREPNGTETRYRLDPVGRVTAMIKPGDTDALPTVALTYLDNALPLGLRTEIRRESGRMETLVQVEYFNGNKEVLQKRESGEGGGTVVDGWRRYNVRGWEAERTSPFFGVGFAYVAGEGSQGPRRYRFTHDALGRVTEATMPDGRATRTDYAPGRITRHDVSDTDDSPENVNRGHFDTPRIEVVDAKGNLRRVIEDAGGAAALTTRYRYDALSRLSEIVDAAGITVARYTHDMLGRKIAVDHTDAGHRRIAHHPSGELALSIDAEGARTTLEYDALGRKSVVRVNGAVTERYTYDQGAGNRLVGRLASVEDEAGTVELSYDLRGLIERKIRTVPVAAGNPRVLSAEYAYDAMERMTQVTFPDGSTVGYRYGDQGLLKEVDGVVTSRLYDELGRIREEDFANGVHSEFEFDPLTFYLTRASVVGPARPEPYHDMQYTYDAVGNPLTITDQVALPGHIRFDRQMIYDARYQLTGVQGSIDGNPFQKQYRFDAAGNFTRNGEFGADDLTLEPGGNRLRGVQTAAGEQVLFDHDGNGNVVRMPGKTLAYDARGRLIRVDRSNGTRVDFTYGFEGERVTKRVTTGGVSEETLYLDNIYEENGGGVRRHVYDGRNRLATLFDDGTRHHYHRDHAGNTVVVTDLAGDIVHESGLFPFGTEAYSSGAAAGAPRLFGDPFDDETGLVFALSRYYDPSSGRFLTPDLFSILNPEKVLALPLHLNPYLYAGNNPMRYVDDEGAWWKWVVGALIIAALVVATIIVGVATGGAGFAFGILLAASIGSALGAGVGVYSAATSGGDLADGFLFGAIVGGAAGALGYAAGAAVGAAGISGVWGSVLAGAAQGAVVGAGSGAISGYAGGTGSVGDIFTQAAIGFAIGAVVGGALGYAAHSPPQVAGTTEGALVTSHVQGTPSEQFWSGAAQAANGWEPVAQSAIDSLATPVVFNVAVTGGTGVIGFGHAAVYHDWDDIRAWILELTGEEEIIVDGPEIDF